MSGSEPGVTSERITSLAREQGFDHVSIARAEEVAGVADRAIEAGEAGLLDGLGWMTRAWLERASDPQQFLPGAKSVLLVAMNYAGDRPGVEPPPGHGRIASYARGRDYHRVFEPRLRRLARLIREEFGAEAKPTVDYGPLLERPLATTSGMGWQGKSTMLLVPGVGPWVMLGAVATTLNLKPGEPLKKTCGSCTRCVVACPTGALGSDGGTLDARLCISYHTIENRGPIPVELRSKFGAWIFGCDDCLTVCPPGWKTSNPNPGLAAVDDGMPALAPLLRLTEFEFSERFRGRAIMRAKRDGFVRNVCVAIGNVGTAEDIEPLKSALVLDASELVRGHAAWALGRLGSRQGIDVRDALLERLDVEDDPSVIAELNLALAEANGQAGSNLPV